MVVADMAWPPIDKTCGEGLMPNTVAALKELGVKLRTEEVVPFRGINFIEAGVSAKAAFPHGHGLGIRRTILHNALVESAAAAGVQLRWGTRVTRSATGEIYVGTATLSSRWIAGADGWNSQVRKWARLDRGHLHPVRYGFRRHFRVAPWSDFVEVHWGRNCQVFATPVGPAEVCVAVTSSSPQLRLESALAEFPEVAHRLEGAPALSKNLGAIAALRVLQRVSRDPFVLIGDASGSVDPLTGEGLGLAFQQAPALVAALVRDDLALYQAEHRKIRRLPVLMSRLLLLLERHAGLRHRMWRTLAEEPQLFARLLATHVGSSSPLDFGIGNSLKLGRGLLAAQG